MHFHLYWDVHIARQRWSLTEHLSTSLEKQRDLYNLPACGLEVTPRGEKSDGIYPPQAPAQKQILTFLSRSWLGSPGASSPISNGLRNFCTKVGLMWKAWNASWSGNTSNGVRFRNKPLLPTPWVIPTHLQHCPSVYLSPRVAVKEGASPTSISAVTGQC